MKTALIIAMSAVVLFVLGTDYQKKKCKNNSKSTITSM